jgi:hypothetical protein
MLMSASQGHCAYKGGTNCGVHVVLGSVITAAAIMDFVLALSFIQCIEHMCVQIDVVTRKVRLFLPAHTR